MVKAVGMQHVQLSKVIGTTESGRGSGRAQSHCWSPSGRAGLRPHSWPNTSCGPPPPAPSSPSAARTSQRWIRSLHVTPMNLDAARGPLAALALPSVASACCSARSRSAARSRDRARASLLLRPPPPPAAAAAAPHPLLLLFVPVASWGPCQSSGTPPLPAASCVLAWSSTKRDTPSAALARAVSAARAALVSGSLQRGLPPRAPRFAAPAAPPASSAAFLPPAEPPAALPLDRFAA